MITIIFWKGLDFIRKYANVMIDRLKPYEHNARTHTDQQLDKIAMSIQEFGFINPVLIDGEYGIIAGHGRVLGAKKIGLQEVPCLFIEDLTEDQKRAYIIADNKLAEDAGWDNEILIAELEALKEVDFDLSIIGFDDLDEIKLNFGETQDVEEDDFDITPPEEPTAKIGDIYQLGDHRLICGDSTDAQTVAKLMNGEKADMVFTDPPWNVNYGDIEEDNPQGYKARKILNDYMPTEEFKNFMFMAFRNMNKNIVDGAMVYVVMSAQEWGNLMLALAENDFHWSSTIIWNKDRLVLSRKDYHTKYEPIWYGWKYGASRIHPLQDRTQSDVWDIQRPTKSELHPTTKPVELVARAITNSSNKNDICIDLFGGSGTTLIACEQLNRRCYMAELDPKYCDVIINRWEAFTGKKVEKIN